MFVLHNWVISRFGDLSVILGNSKFYIFIFIIIYSNIHILSFKFITDGDLGTVAFYSDKRLELEVDFKH